MRSDPHPIEPGDLVVVVHAHCGQAERVLGLLRTVTAVRRLRLGGAVCGACAARIHEPGADVEVAVLDRELGTHPPGHTDEPTYPLAWLRRIRPMTSADRYAENFPAAYQQARLAALEGAGKPGARSASGDSPGRSE